MLITEYLVTQAQTQCVLVFVPFRTRQHARITMACLRSQQIPGLSSRQGPIPPPRRDLPIQPIRPIQFRISPVWHDLMLHIPQAVIQMFLQAKGNVVQPKRVVCYCFLPFKLALSLELHTVDHGPNHRNSVVFGQAGTRLFLKFHSP